ncbi:MAG TPA: DinB family protein [Candidatus Acidoferrales bacterium]
MSVPAKDEAAVYYFTYIDRIREDDVVGAMERQLREASELFSTISEEKSLHRYAPEKWSIRESLNHVSDTERAFAFRALWFGRGFSDPLASFDQNVGVAGARADEYAWARHVAEFGDVRRASLALFGNLPAEAWKRSGVASGNLVTVNALAYIIAGHCAHHLAILRERYL